MKTVNPSVERDEETPAQKIVRILARKTALAILKREYERTRRRVEAAEASQVPCADDAI